MPTTFSPKLAPVSYADLLARAPLFSGLAQAQLTALAASTFKRRYKRGEVLIKQGETSHALYILLVGRASVIVSDSTGREVILATVSQGDCLGEMSLIDGGPHSAHVVADVETDALILGRDELLLCLEESPAAALSMMRQLVGRLRQADEKIESLALIDVYGRVARFLLDMATKNHDGTLSIKAKVSKLIVAKTIGASREMVTKVFKALTQKGIITSHIDGSLHIQTKTKTFLNEYL